MEITMLQSVMRNQKLFFGRSYEVTNPLGAWQAKGLETLHEPVTLDGLQKGVIPRPTGR